ncbi:MAG TPA: hypothetical protein VFW71_09090 [Actinomycetota bacterium]|nr:hypothetical protein [Actinomycetota bacterium]
MIDRRAWILLALVTALVLAAMAAAGAFWGLAGVFLVGAVCTAAAGLVRRRRRGRLPRD